MIKKYSQLSTILKQFLFDYNMRPIDLARALNMPAPTIHRILTGKSMSPYQSSLKPIANYFSVSIDQLLGNEPFESPVKETKFVTKRPQNINKIPLYAWESLLDRNKPLDEAIYAGNISEAGFAAIMPDSSMEPVFARGSLLIFDAINIYKDRSFVLVKLHGSTIPSFRQLLVDLDQKYIKPLNPDLNSFKIRRLGDDDEIIARLLEARQMYNE